MGANVRGVFAFLENEKVFCIVREIEKVKIFCRKAKSVKAEAISKNFVPADDSTLENRVSKSDLFF